MNKLLPVELDFFKTAPVKSICHIETDASVEQLFETIRGDSIWTEWATGLTNVTWTSPQPYGQGSTRDVDLMAGMKVKETFFHWVEGERVSFYVTDTNIPGISKFAEDYMIETVNGKTRLTWTVAIENSLGFMNIFAPINSFFTQLVLKGWLKKYKVLLDKMA